MAVSNVVGYLFVLLVSRALGAERFGGLSALSAWGIVLSVPAGALQVIVARHVAAGREVASMRRMCWRLGAALATVTIAATPLLVHRFGLQSWWSVLWLGLTLVPMTLTGLAQGILLGAGRLRDLAVLYLLGGFGRLTVGMLAAAVGASVAQIFALLLVAAGVSAGWGLLRAARVRTADDGPPAGVALELARSTVSLGAFIALTNTDVILARALLDTHASGGYALASTFARAIGWGTQFVALLVVPRVQRGVGAGRALARASVVVVTMGLAATGVLAVAPGWWIRLAGGPDFTPYAHLVVACAALGTVWALAQVWLFADMARGDTVLGRLTWAVVVGQVIAVRLWWHERPGELIAVFAAGATTIVVVACAREFRSRGTARARAARLP